jgi:hypothetical protein
MNSSLNRISLAIPEADLQAVRDALQVLQDKLLPHLLTLAPEERRELPKMGDKTVALVRKAANYARADGSLRPSYLDLEEMERDIQAVDDFEHPATAPRPARGRSAGLGAGRRQQGLWRRRCAGPGSRGHRQRSGPTLPRPPPPAPRRSPGLSAVPGVLARWAVPFRTSPFSMRAGQSRGAELGSWCSKPRHRSSEHLNRKFEFRHCCSELRYRSSKPRLRSLELRCRSLELRCRGSEPRRWSLELRSRRSAFPWTARKLR